MLRAANWVGASDMRTWLRGLSLAAMCAALSGCISFGSIGDRGMALNEGVGGWQNRGILLNLVRASREEPLYFLSLNNAVAQGTTDFKFGYPLFTLGPHLTLPQKQYSFGGGGTNVLDNSTYTQFQVNVYSNTAFYQGIMQPLSLTEVNLLLNQGFPRELVFYLVIDKAKLTDTTGKSFFVYNDPSNPGYQLFVQAIKAAMVHGLTTEVPNPDWRSPTPTAPAPAAPGPSAALDAGSAAHDAAATGGGPPNTAAPGLTVSHAAPPEPQLCFEQALATDDAKKEFAALTAEGKTPNYCGHGPAANRQLTVRLLGQDYEVEVYTRSVSSIFRYLGAALAHPERTPVLVDYAVPSEVTPAGPILSVQAQGGITGFGCFAHVYYADQAWCVPEHGPQITRDVFNVLTMLVALKQQPSDLPASTVLLGG
jgi:hypothetical protein